jgi:uncharacterized protein
VLCWKLIGLAIISRKASEKPKSSANPIGTKTDNEMQEYSKLDHPAILSRLFYPHRVPKTPLPKGAMDIDFAVESDIILGCRFYIHDLSAPSILYFHGNGEIVCDHDDIAEQYMNVGCNLLVMSYRGYGWSSGSPSVTSLFSDARTIFTEVTDRLKTLKFSGPLFVMGRSLGSACAIDLAVLFGDSLKGLIIESGFADSLPLLKLLGVDPSKMKIGEEDCFGNRKKIARVTLPTLLLHGAQDQLIPVAEAEKLQSDSGARNKQFFLIPGADHNTLISVAGIHYFQMIRRFIDSVTGESSWRNIRRRQRKDREPGA